MRGERMDGARSIALRRLGILFFFVEFEQTPCLFKVEEVSVDDELVFACVRGYLVNALDGMTVLSKLLNEKIDVYHSG
jgi:hypothetical protein